MEPSISPVDTFSNTFSSDHFASFNLGNQSASPTTANPPAQGDRTSPTQTNARRANISSSGQGRQSAPHTPGLNPRSCVTCRKRKVKCDKKPPCSNCVKASIECIFPKPGRAPRRTKKPQDAELLARLRRLEGVVQKLGKDTDGEDLSPERKNSQGSSRYAESQSPRRTLVDRNEKCPKSVKTNYEDAEERYNTLNTFKLEKEMGKMVVGEGRSRYVSNGLWSGLTEEIAEMRDLLNYSSEEDEAGDDHSTPASNGIENQSGKVTHQEFIFGYSSTMTTLRILHPPASQIMEYWTVYKSHVDPVVRLLHKPTAEKLFLQASKDQSSLSKSAEPMVFAVYMAAVTALNEEECESRLGISKQTGLRRYRYATEQALSRAGFLSTHEFIVLQAFTLFLVCVRRHQETKDVWALTGLLLRMAHSMGIHRDGSQFGLTHFDTEMRRRLWWQACTLELRASEDQGSDPLSTDRFFDTKRPLNINDSDMWPGMEEPPIEHEGCTEMTFDLVRYEVGETIRLLSTMSKCPHQDSLEALQAKEATLEKLRLRLEDKYLRHCDMSNPVQWVAANVSRLVMAKIGLVIHHPFTFFKSKQNGLKVSQETRDRTFLTSVEVVRYSSILQTQQNTLQWGWLFKSYFQWHAAAFLLAELCTRTSGPAVDDAWNLIEEAWPRWDDGEAQTKSVLWRPVRRLYARAKAIRLKELERRKQYPADGQLGPVMPLSTTRNPIMGQEPTSTAMDIKADPAFVTMSPYQSDEQPLPPEYPTPAQGDFDLAQILPDTNENLYNLDGMGMWVDDPMLQQDPMLDGTMDWANWDDSMAKNLQDPAQQPMEFGMSSLWVDG